MSKTRKIKDLQYQSLRYSGYVEFIGLSVHYLPVSCRTYYGYTVDVNRKLVYPWFDNYDKLLTVWYEHENFEDGGFEILLAYEYSSYEEFLKIDSALRRNLGRVNHKFRNTDEVHDYKLKKLLMR